MTVIFDEVIATIEPPLSHGEEQEATEETSSSDEMNTKVVQLIKTQQRRAKRLLAE